MYARLLIFIVIALALMTASCTANIENLAITEQDRALFDQAANESAARNVGAVLQSCPEILVGGREFPLAEPNYSSKRTIVFDSFEDALVGFNPERAREIDALLVKEPFRRSRS